MQKYIFETLLRKEMVVEVIKKVEREISEWNNKFAHGKCCEKCGYDDMVECRSSGSHGESAYYYYSCEQCNLNQPSSKQVFEELAYDYGIVNGKYSFIAPKYFFKLFCIGLVLVIIWVIIMIMNDKIVIK